MRKYLDRIEIWGGSATYDGYAGNSLTDAKIADSWANVITLSATRQTNLGLDIGRTVIEIRTRYRNDLDYYRTDIFVKYRGMEFTINQVTEINLDGREFLILATS